MNSIAELVKELPSERKSVLFDTFFSVWSNNGFGTMTKKDTELLLFRCLKELLGDQTPENNYKWASLLRVTPQKVKALRLESYLRFAHLFPSSEGSGPVKYFRQLHTLHPQISVDKAENLLENVKVSFILEDPIAQMQLENDLKESGTYLDFHRNREVVKLRFIDFLKIIQTKAPDKVQIVIDNILQNKVQDGNQLNELRKALKKKDFALKTESQKFFSFVKLLGNTFASRPTALIEYVGVILGSSEE